MVPLNKKIVEIIEAGWYITEISRSPNEREWRGRARNIIGHGSIYISDASDVPHLLSKMRSAIKQYQEE